MVTRISTGLPRGLQLLLDVHEAVVLCNALAAARRPGLQVAGPQPDGQVCDEVVRGLPGAMGDEDAPPEPKC